MKLAKNIAMASLSFFAASGAGSAPIDPFSLASLGLLTGQDISIDTDTGAVSDAGGSLGTGTLISQGGGTLPDIFAFAFTGGSVLGNVAVTGGSALALLFQGDVSVAGSIDISASGRIGRAGGWNGGLGAFGTNNPARNGLGPGGGTGGSASASNFGVGGGAGGGFGGAGDDGGAGATTKAGGAAYGDPLAAALQGGSGGGGGGHNNTSGRPVGGGAGGALEIGSAGSISFEGSARIQSNGAKGGEAPNSLTGGGGGSGGGILVHGFAIDIMNGAMIQANGGDGGELGSQKRGACGGSGRIEFLYNTAGSFINNGTTEALLGSDRRDLCSTSASENIVSATATDDVGQPPSGVVPLPSSIYFLAGALGLLAMRRRFLRA